MLKKELREQGYSITEHCQKHTTITLIWVVSAAVMIASAFVTTALIDRLAVGDFAYNTFLERILDFFNKIAHSINTPFGYDGLTSLIYLSIWFGIFAAVRYAVNNISSGQEVNKLPKAAVFVLLAILVLAALFIFMAEIAYCYDEIEYNYHTDSTGYYHRSSPPAFGFLYLFVGIFYSFGLGFGFVFYLIFVLFVYMALKLIMTISACSNKYGNIQFKLLKHNAMPVCHCKEGLKIPQAFLIYFLPAIFMYSLIYILFIRNSEYILFIFLTFFTAFDLTAAVYILYFKLKYKANYIALDNHIYDATLYKATYVKPGDKKAVSNSYVDVRAVIKQKEQTKLFTEMTTCVNPQCENYALEFGIEEKLEKRCPVCGKRKYTAKVFTGVMTCPNRDCEQFGQELKKDIEECSVCGAKIGQIALKFNPGLVIPAVITTAAACAVYAVFTLFLYDYLGMDGESVLRDAMNFLVFAFYAAGIIMAWVSKNKKAFAAAIIFFPLIALILKIVVL